MSIANNSMNLISMLAFETFVIPLDRKFTSLADIHEAWKKNLRPMVGLIHQVFYGTAPESMNRKEVEILEYAVSTLIDQLVRQGKRLVCKRS